MFLFIISDKKDTGSLTYLLLSCPLRYLLDYDAKRMKLSFYRAYIYYYFLAFQYYALRTIRTPRNKVYRCTNFGGEFEATGDFIGAEASNSRRRPSQRARARARRICALSPPRSKEFHLQIPLHVLRTGSIAKEFLLDRGFRVRLKVRNGETANGPSGMICAQHTQELQNRRGKTPSSTPAPAHCPFPRFLCLSLLIYTCGIRCTGCLLTNRQVV